MVQASLLLQQNGSLMLTASNGTPEDNLSNFSYAPNTSCFAMPPGSACTVVKLAVVLLARYDCLVLLVGVRLSFWGSRHSAYAWHSWLQDLFACVCHKPHGPLFT